MEPLYFLGLDFETQDANAKTTNITEIGAVLYEKVGDRITEIQHYNTLCYEDSYPKQSQKIVDLTGIDDEMLMKVGNHPKNSLLILRSLIDKAHIVFAHKISFDKIVYESNCKKYGVDPGEMKEWICTLTNFPWPTNLTCHKLSHLAYEHGIMVDPRTLHRADQDVRLMIELITTKYKFEDILTYAREPWVYVKAEVRAPWTDTATPKQTEVAKGLGFSWEMVKGTDFPFFHKTWVTRVKASKLEKLKLDVVNCSDPFRIAVVEGIT